ncbi:MAG: hypothetical protein EOO73_36265 [Myxococcales bacterium]|nr:MAG: hypothetical protein EOO73_36265 [Myxococcales bacterium]
MTISIAQDSGGTWAISGVEPNSATPSESCARAAAYRTVLATQMTAPALSIIAHAALVETELRHLLYLTGIDGALDTTRDPAGFLNSLVVLGGPGPSNGAEMIFRVAAKLIQGVALDPTELEKAHSWAEGALGGIRRRTEAVKKANG